MKTFLPASFALLLVSFSSKAQLPAVAPGLTHDFETGLLNPGVTPLNIINFDAVATSTGKAVISWDVVTEKDINSYTIERSTDGLYWEVFGVLPGNASSNNQEHFLLTDNHPYPGMSYYRLMQMDIDNSIFYTGIKMVGFGNTVTANIEVNNPFHQTISMRLTASADGKLTTELIDLTGKVLRHQEERAVSGPNTIIISNLSALANGIYFIRVSSGTQQYSVKLIKE